MVEVLLLMFLAVFPLARLFLGFCLIRLFVLFLPADGNSLELLKYMVSVDMPRSICLSKSSKLRVVMLPFANASAFNIVHVNNCPVLEDFCYFSPI